ncbi:alpha/beta fold hydrolase [Variovorax soli]|uniref:alpha/beta fold hydrolase n=1 Tax=Variovorax soli TaxID=376815 RepID=UPI000838B1BD|nr:alpha/beta hydrolase [Variovorax soli]
MTTAPPITLHRGPGDGLSLHYAACGERGRPLIVFLHGFPECWWAWEPYLREFGRDHFAIAPDTRGINLSDKPAELRDYRAPRVAQDIVALAELLGYQDFLLVGHDWGASIAYSLVLAHPQRVRRLAILNGVHPAVFARELAQSPAQRNASDYINLFRQPDAAQLLTRDGCAYLLDMFADEPGGALPAWLDDEVQGRYLAAWSQPGAVNGGLNYYRASPLHPAQSDPRAAFLAEPEKLRVPMPTLVLWGERDRYLLPGCIDRLEAFVPQLRVHRQPHCTHWIAHEEPAWVMRRLREHFA